VTALPATPSITSWLAFGERGISSEAIVHKLVYGKTGRPRAYPYDPDDFRRCELLLRWEPLLRLQLHHMAEVDAVWAGLVARWKEIVELMEQECPGVWETRPRGSAPKAYALMQEIRKAGNG